MKFVSLFSGVGGFDLGFERAGMECVAQVEIDAKCREVLAQHWPDVTRHEDVKEVSFERDAVDLVCGGFPCQDLSVAGKRAGLAGERSGLWHEFHRILAESRPRWAVIENVPGLLSSNKGRDFAVVLRGLVELGYGVCWRILDAQYFGVAQRRRRVFIVASLGNGRCAQVLFERDRSGGDSAPSREAGEGVTPFTSSSFGGYREGVGTLRESGGDIGPGSETLVFRQQRSDRYEESDTAHTLAARDHKDATDLVVFDGSQVTSALNGSNPQPGDPSHPLSAMGANQTLLCFEPGNLTRPCGSNPNEFVAPTLGADKQGDTFPHIAAFTFVDRASTGAVLNDVSHTLQAHPQSETSNVQHGVLSGSIVRRLTPVECCRLQGFPDAWNEGQSDSTRYKQMGNAVCVPVAEWIGRRIVALE